MFTSRGCSCSRIQTAALTAVFRIRIILMRIRPDPDPDSDPDPKHCLTVNKSTTRWQHRVMFIVHQLEVAAVVEFKQQSKQLISRPPGGSIRSGSLVNQLQVTAVIELKQLISLLRIIFAKDPRSEIFIFCFFLLSLML